MIAARKAADASCSSNGHLAARTRALDLVLLSGRTLPTALQRFAALAEERPDPGPTCYA
jgi:hypothetical protein